MFDEGVSERLWFGFKGRGECAAIVVLEKKLRPVCEERRGWFV